MVPTLVLLNVVVFVVTVAQAHSVVNNQLGPLFAQWELRPVLAAHGWWWQFVTSGFLHFGPIHIAMNMLALWIIGRDLERVLGSLRFSVIYLVSLFGGSVSVFVFGAPGDGVAGASGAVYGLMGGLLVVVYRLKLNPSSVIGLIVINLVISVAIPGISILDHLGGLVTGAALTALTIYAPAANRLRWQVGGHVVVVLVLLGLVLVRTSQLTALTP
jgi:membrane associated rhomboid family serine protease